MSLRLNAPLPDLSGATEWINGRIEGAGLAGQPALIYFWSVSCHICQEHMPKLAAWRCLYAPRGLRFVAIHVPRQAQDTDLGLVRTMLDALQIGDPCGVDNLHAIKSAFAASYLPAYFLFDRAARLRARTGGDAGMGLLERPMERLFQQESTAAFSVVPPMPASAGLAHFGRNTPIV